VNNQAHSGRYQWYSNRGDNIDVTLTREFDLSNLSEATLQFWTWYDLETDWDYAYVTISTDEGKTWDILPATSTTNTNPVGQAYGPGFTGMSGWTQETVELSPYVGQKVLLRFEYITDDAVNLPGFAVDDIAIPQLEYIDDVEQGDGGWIARGFIRTDNLLPQQFTGQIIEFVVDGSLNIAPLALDEANTGQYIIAGLGETIQKAVLIISAQSPVTTVPTQYTYSITPVE
jgi:hypothetical protein